MGRLVSVLLAVLLVTSIADAKTPLRKCRKACKPLVASVCPPKGKALRRCRTPILRECRREGIAACAFGLPTGGPDDGTATSTTTTTPAQATTSTTVTSPVSTTTTLPPFTGPSVAGTWLFEGVLAEAGCNFSDDEYHEITSALAVLQDGSTLSGTMDGAAAAGAVSATGWSFNWNDGYRESAEATCRRRFTVTATGPGSPTPADATATAICTDNSTCQARWTGSVTRVP